MISKRGTTFSDFLRGLLVDDSVPEASNIRQGRQLRPATSNPHPNGNQDPQPHLTFLNSCHDIYRPGQPSREYTMWKFQEGFFCHLYFV